MLCIFKRIPCKYVVGNGKKVIMLVGNVFTHTRAHMHTYSSSIHMHTAYVASIRACRRTLCVRRMDGSAELPCVCVEHRRRSNEQRQHRGKGYCQPRCAHAFAGHTRANVQHSAWPACTPRTTTTFIVQRRARMYLFSGSLTARALTRKSYHFIVTTLIGKAVNLHVYVIGLCTRNAGGAQRTDSKQLGEFAGGFAERR